MLFEIQAPLKPFTAAGPKMFRDFPFQSLRLLLLQISVSLKFQVSNVHTAMNERHGSLIIHKSNLTSNRSFPPKYFHSPVAEASNRTHFNAPRFPFAPRVFEKIGCCWLIC